MVVSRAEWHRAPVSDSCRPPDREVKTVNRRTLAARMSVAALLRPPIPHHTPAVLPPPRFRAVSGDKVLRMRIPSALHVMKSGIACLRRYREILRQKMVMRKRNYYLQESKGAADLGLGAISIKNDT